MDKPKYFSVISYKNEENEIENVTLFLKNKIEDEKIVSFAANRIAKKKHLKGDDLIFQCFGDDYSVFTSEIPEDSVLIEE